MCEHHLRRRVTETRSNTENTERGENSRSSPILYKLSAATIYFRQIELIFRRPGNKKKVGWLVYVADSNNLIAYHIETCTVHYPAAHPRSIAHFIHLTKTRSRLTRYKAGLHIYKLTDGKTRDAKNCLVAYEVFVLKISLTVCISLLLKLQR